MSRIVIATNRSACESTASIASSLAWPTAMAISTAVDASHDSARAIANARALSAGLTRPAASAAVTNGYKSSMDIVTHYSAMARCRRQFLATTTRIRGVRRAR